jgi:hypothetical protein
MKTQVKLALPAIAQLSWPKPVYVRFIAIIKLPFKFDRSSSSNKPANGERMIRQSVGGLAIGSCAL